MSREASRSRWGHLNVVGAGLQTEIGGRKVRVGGMAKGSGMINPDLATLLGVITTDAAVEPALWRNIVKRGAARSFNQVRFLPAMSVGDPDLLFLFPPGCGGPTMVRCVKSCLDLQSSPPRLAVRLRHIHSPGPPCLSLERPSEMVKHIV